MASHTPSVQQREQWKKRYLLDFGNLLPGADLTNRISWLVVSMKALFGKNGVVKVLVVFPRSEALSVVSRKVAR